MAEPNWKSFGPREDRTWRRFDATYGSNYGMSFFPKESEMAGKNIRSDEQKTPAETPESRWTGEGGSSQHYRHTDEPGEAGETGNVDGTPGYPDGAESQRATPEKKRGKKRDKNVPH